MEANPSLSSSSDASALGQKFAFATASLVLGLACFVSLLGLEKAVLAVVFGALALRRSPPPALDQRRGWAWLGVGLGATALVVVPTVLLVFRERLAVLLDALQKLP